MESRRPGGNDANSAAAETAALHTLPEQPRKTKITHGFAYAYGVRGK